MCVSKLFTTSTQQMPVLFPQILALGRFQHLLNGSPYRHETTTMPYGESYAHIQYASKKVANTVYHLTVPFKRRFVKNGTAARKWKPPFNRSVYHFTVPFTVSPFTVPFRCAPRNHSGTPARCQRQFISGTRSSSCRCSIELRLLTSVF